jgi:hypothetical protein
LGYFSHGKTYFLATKNELGYSLGDFLPTNASGHPDWKKI